jgi:hypothetical protein
MNFKFNHEAEEIHTALGIQEDVLTNLSEKLVELDSSLEDGENISTTRVIEKIISMGFTQEQLYILAGFEIMSRIKDKQEAMLSILSKMKEMLKQQSEE